MKFQFFSKFGKTHTQVIVWEVVLHKWTREVLIKYCLAYGHSSSVWDQNACDLPVLKCMWVVVWAECAKSPHVALPTSTPCQLQKYLGNKIMFGLRVDDKLYVSTSLTG
jgi:hypothetical protein